MNIYIHVHIYIHTHVYIVVMGEVVSPLEVVRRLPFTISSTPSRQPANLILSEEETT